MTEPAVVYTPRAWGVWSLGGWVRAIGSASIWSGSEIEARAKAEFCNKNAGPWGYTPMLIPSPPEPQ